MEERAVMEMIISHFKEADENLGWYGNLSSQWRNTICLRCARFPFSTLRRAFHDRYGGITEEGEPPVPLNTLTHHNNNDNNPHLDWDTMEDDYNNPDLDWDATEEILRRLPVPSLMRAKSVCKAWNMAIAGSTLNLSDETSHFVSQLSYRGIAFFCAALNRWFRIPLPWNKNTWDRNKHYHPHPTSLVLCAAAAGLFLFLDFYDNAVIFNFLTKQHRFLPRLKGWKAGATAELMVESGHFEIITIDLYDKVLLYNSTTDEWKDIPVRADFPVGQKHTHPWKSTLHNGMAYFTNNFGRHLGCYDIARREFQFMEIEGGLPPQIDYHDFANNRHASLPALVACNGKLLLVGRLEKKVGEGSIWGGFPFIEHALVGIWELDSRAENYKSWSLISVTPQDLLEHTVKSSHGTDFMVAASDRIWLTIKGSMALLTLDLSSMEWSVLPGYTAEDTVDCFPRRAVCVPFRISSSLSLSTNPPEPIE